MIFVDLANASGDTMTPEHFKDDVLGADPLRERSAQFYPEDRGRRGRIRFAGHRKRDIEPARANRQHAERASSGRMAVGSQQRRAGAPEALHVHDMADAVARPGVPNAEPPTGAFEKEVVLRIKIVDLQQIVIDILHARLGLHSIGLQSLER